MKQLFQRSSRNNELKFFDTGLSFSFDATGEVPASGQLTLIPQGITESTRLGRKCVIKSIELRAEISYVPAASTIGSDVVHLYVVLDKQCNGAAAAITDVMTSADFNNNLKNLDNSDRFVILKKFVVTLNSAAGAAAAFSTNTQMISWYKKCNIPIEFDNSAATGAITTIRSNNLFLIAGATIEDDKTTCTGIVRLRYEDN